ncbi:MAG: VOC family protein [Chloroflexi bacterium]|nr:VOC family protein [Chloroflexota bacterium]
MDRTLTHFELPATDPVALGKFYSDLFGWSIEKMPGPLDYWLAETTADRKGASLGIYRKEKLEDIPLNYITVESVADFASKAEALGGKIMVPKGPVPGQGYFAVIADPEGNPLGLFESDPSAQ